MKYRDHRGGFLDSMRTVVEIPATRMALATHLLRRGYLDLDPSRITVLPYIEVDSRNQWKTFIVLVDDIPAGFTDGPLDKEEPEALEDAS